MGHIGAVSVNFLLSTNFLVPRKVCLNIYHKKNKNLALLNTLFCPSNLAIGLLHAYISKLVAFDSSDF